MNFRKNLTFCPYWQVYIMSKKNSKQAQLVIIFIFSLCIFHDNITTKNVYWKFGIGRQMNLAFTFCCQETRRALNCQKVLKFYLKSM